MRPAFSVVFLTTLCGAAQGLLLALVAVQCLAAAGSVPAPAAAFYIAGSAASVVLGALGLLASFFHLGHPERAWRAVAMWRTSWLSRECLALPAFLALTFFYGCAHMLAWPPAAALALGLLAVLAAAALFVCTSMIYACLRFLQEWASPLTMVNFVLLGCASGFTLATLAAACFAPGLVGLLAACACVLTAAGLLSRLASLGRNARLHPKSTLQSATGIRSDNIRQVSRGFTASAFNTREFFHGQTPAALKTAKYGFLLAAFVVPFVLLALGWSWSQAHAAGAMPGLVGLLVVAFLIQYAGLVAERWFFFTEARHPQNLYYQRAA
jgi:DMSO reductase anchor subunit